MNDFADEVASIDNPFDPEIDRLIDAAALDDLIRIVDALCVSRRWAELFALRHRVRAATRSGRQVWPIATLCEYRLALHAPAEWACRVVNDESSRFTIGPLTEVLAQNHTWVDVAPCLEPGPPREFVAHERAIRGDVIDESETPSIVLEIPLQVQDWEPDFALAQYTDAGLVAPCGADTWTHEWCEIRSTPGPVDAIDDDLTDAALRSLVDPWTSGSTGTAMCTIVEGGPAQVVAALNRPSVRADDIEAGRALHWLAWCGASGGSHGRRRGNASGRFAMWWMLAALGGVIDEWDDLRASNRLGPTLGRVATSLDWTRIDLGQRHAFELALVAHDRTENLSFGLFAHDDPFQIVSSELPQRP